jgi:hypothetical protein
VSPMLRLRFRLRTLLILVAVVAVAVTAVKFGMFVARWLVLTHFHD